MTKRYLWVLPLFLLVPSAVRAEQDFYGIQIKNEAWARQLVLSQGPGGDVSDLSAGPVLDHAVRAEASLKELGDRLLDFRVTVFNDSGAAVSTERNHRDFVLHTRDGRKFPLIDEEEDAPSVLDPKAKTTFTPSAGNLRLANSEVEMIVCTFDLGRTQIFLFPWSKKDGVSKLVSPQPPPPPVKPEKKKPAPKPVKEAKTKEIAGVRELAEDVKEIAKDVKETKQIVKEIRQDRGEPTEVIKEVVVEKPVVKEVVVEREVVVEKEVFVEREEKEPRKQAPKLKGPKKKTPKRNFWDWLGLQKTKREYAEKVPVKPTAVEHRSAAASAPAAPVVSEEKKPSVGIIATTQRGLDAAIQKFKYVPADAKQEEPSAPATPEQAAAAMPSSGPTALEQARGEAHVIGFNKTYNFITLNIGERDGLRKNAIVSVVRDGRVVAKAKVKQLREGVSAATIISGTTWNEIRAGDRISLA